MTRIPDLTRRLAKMFRDPVLFTKRAQTYVAAWRTARAIRAGERRLSARVEQTPPIRLGTMGEVEVRTLSGHGRVAETVAMLKALYRFVPHSWPALVHDDGTLDRSDVMRLTAHFPNIRVLSRVEADAIIGPELAARRLPRCLSLRESTVFGLKLFDLMYFAFGKRILYIDSDIVIERRPDTLLEALAAPDDEWKDRYNQDVKSSYVWRSDAIRIHAGVEPLPMVNSGLLCLRIDSLDWELFEHCLELPERGWWVEQSLYAIYLAKRGAEPLPPEYDVCFRHAWEGEPRTACLAERRRGRAVVSQHYCGADPYRVLMYERLMEALDDAQPAASESWVRDTASSEA
jgi:hypothetical protein